MSQTFTEAPLAADTYNRSDWPVNRGDRDAFVQRFGEERAKRFDQAFWAMDPVADALYTGGHKSKEIMPNLRDALARGEADENTFPEVKALIDDMNSALDGVDWERLERGQRVALSIPVLAQNLSLGPGALIHTYATPSIANILVNTGELTEGAVHRLAYTTNWIYSVYLKDGLKPGHVSYIHTGMVRSMHAHVRNVQTKLGLDTSDWGAPISEFDMLRTWFDFTYIAFTYLRNLGYRLTVEEEQDLFYAWKIVGLMLGIPGDLLVNETDIDASQETIDAIHAIDGEPNEASFALVEAPSTASVPTRRRCCSSRTSPSTTGCTPPPASCTATRSRTSTTCPTRSRVRSPNLRCRRSRQGLTCYVPTRRRWIGRLNKTTRSCWTR